MSEVNTNEKSKQEGASLAPIPKDKRIMSWGSNTMLWLGGCISIGTLAQGSAQLEAGLNLLQLFLAVAIGSLILVIGIALNDQFSYNTGAPYAVQLRSAFGTKGNIVPSLIRGLPAIYGTDTRPGLEEPRSTIFPWRCLDLTISGCGSSCSRSCRSCFPSRDSRGQSGSETSAVLLFPSL